MSEVGGGWRAIDHSLKLARKVGFRSMWKAVRSKNSCKTCAVGMGGQLGGMVNEGAYFPEVCKKSVQAMACDRQGGVRDEFFSKYSINQTMALSPRELEASGRLVKPLVTKAGDTHHQRFAERHGRLVDVVFQLFGNLAQLVASDFGLFPTSFGGAIRRLARSKQHAIDSGTDGRARQYGEILFVGITCNFQIKIQPTRQRIHDDV